MRFARPPFFDISVRQRGRRIRVEERRDIAREALRLVHVHEVAGALVHQKLRVRKAAGELALRFKSNLVVELAGDQAGSIEAAANVRTQ